MGRWGYEKQTRPAQRDSGMSILKTCPYCPFVFKNHPAQPDSPALAGSNSGFGCSMRPRRFSYPFYKSILSANRFFVPETDRSIVFFSFLRIILWIFS
jgi:hypothetical protein